jgi:K+-sensing histidine kinase KdpD
MGMIANNKGDERRQGRLRAWAGADALIGSIICGLAAGGASLVAGSYHWRTVVPLVFTSVLLIIALLFGSRAGIVGSLVAAMVFAAFLFQPLGRLHVVDNAARANLGWMLLIGVSFSFLFAPPTSGLRH